MKISKKIMLLIIFISVIFSTITPIIEASSTIAQGSLGENHSKRPLCRTSDGIFHCVYTRIENGYFQVFHSYSSDNGETWTERQLTFENYDQLYPSIASDSNDIVHFVWQGCHADSPYFSQIRYMRYDGSWSSITPITTDTEWNHRDPTIAVDSNDYLHVIFQKVEYIGSPWCTDGCGQLYHCTYISSWSEPVPIGEGVGYNEVEPTLIIDSENNLHFAWRDGGEKNMRCWSSGYQKYKDNWLGVEPFECYLAYPSIAVDSVGICHLVGNYGPYSSSVVYKKRIVPDWHSETIGADGTGSRSPSISIDKNDVIYVVWSDVNGNIVYRNYTNQWNDEKTLVASGTAGYPKLLWSYYPIVNNDNVNIINDGVAFVYNENEKIKFFYWQEFKKNMLDVKAVIDEDLLDLLDQYADDYFNSNWNLNINQYKLWILTIAWGEGGKGGYVAHSQYGIKKDVFFHHKLKDKFKFSTGIGPFQIDNGGWGYNLYGPYGRWGTFSTIEKLNYSIVLKEVLKFHYDKFKNNENLHDICNESSKTWYAVEKPTIGSLWKSVTGTEWNSYRNEKKDIDWIGIKKQIAGNVKDDSYQYNKNVIYMGKIKWNITKGVITDTNKNIILDDYLDTWNIKSRDDFGNLLYDYYYTKDENEEIEIWVLNNSEDRFNAYKYIFSREYSIHQFPENRSKDLLYAGHTLEDSALDPNDIQTEPAYNILENGNEKTTPGFSFPYILILLFVTLLILKSKNKKR